MSEFEVENHRHDGTREQSLCQGCSCVCGEAESPSPRGPGSHYASWHTDSELDSDDVEDTRGVTVVVPPSGLAAPLS